MPGLYDAPTQIFAKNETKFWLLQRKKREEAAILCWKRNSYRVLQGPRGKFGLLGSPLHSPASSRLLLGVHPIKTARDLSDCTCNGNRIVVTGNQKHQQHDLHLLRPGGGLVGYPTLATPETNQDTWNSGCSLAQLVQLSWSMALPVQCLRSVREADLDLRWQFSGDIGRSTRKSPTAACLPRKSSPASKYCSGKARAEATQEDKSMLSATRAALRTIGWHTAVRSNPSFHVKASPSVPQLDF